MIGSSTAFRPQCRRSCNSCSSAHKAHPGPRQTHKNQNTVGCQNTHWEQEEEGRSGKKRGEGCRKPLKLYSIGILTAVPLPTFPWHWVRPISLHYLCVMQHCLCCTAETSVPAKQQCSRQKSLIQQIYTSIGLGAYYTENTARVRENMTKQKHWPKYRRWQGWRNPTLCKSMHLKGKSCYSDFPLANCPSGEQKVSLWFTKITRITWFLNKFLKAFKKFLLTLKFFHDN